MNNIMTTLPESREEIAQIILSKDSEIQRLEEEVRLLRQSIFGPKSEKLPDGDSPQLLLFDMPENPPEEEDMEADEIVVPTHTRKKRGRKPLPKDLPRIEVTHDIPEEEKICACGCALSRIGEETSEKLDIIPTKMQVIVHIRPKYACKECEGLDENTPSVKIAPVPAQIIPKGLATAGLLSHVLVAKFCDALPFYRQEKQFSRIKIDIPRQTMCNWAMKAADACEDIVKLLHEEIRGGPLINADETTVQVLHEPGRRPTTKSYMWVFRGGTPEKPVVIYQYHPSRSADVAEVFLRGYKGAVQTDGYAGYDFLDHWQDVLHVACWAHARRKFYEAKKASATKKAGSADKALAMIKRLYSLEKQAKKDDLNAKGVKEMRQRDAKPIIEEMKKWLEKRVSQVLPKGLLGKAINYCLNQWHCLTNYLENGFAGIDNNRAENAIRPFVIGRKNWLFSGTPAGARASATIYSLIESAKACGLEPYAYLRYLFENLPKTLPAERGRLLPSALTAQDLLLAEKVTGV